MVIDFSMVGIVGTECTGCRDMGYAAACTITHTAVAGCLEVSKATVCSVTSTIVGGNVGNCRVTSSSRLHRKWSQERVVVEGGVN